MYFDNAWIVTWYNRRDEEKAWSAFKTEWYCTEWRTATEEDPANSDVSHCRKVR